MTKYQILGQSNSAVAVILDILKGRYPEEEMRVEIVGNIPAEENSSANLPYAVPGIECREVFHADWQYDPDAPVLMGSLGKSRRKIFDFFHQHYGITADRYDNIIHPSAVIAAACTIGHGVHISPGSTISPYATLGNFTVINRHVSIGHHTVLEDFVAVNPGCTIAGVCRLGAGVTVGAGATIIDTITIGENTVIGAGSVVTKNLPANVVAYGVPAKVVREI